MCIHCRCYSIGDVILVYTVTHDIFLLSVARANGVSKCGRRPGGAAVVLSYIISNYTNKKL